MKTSKTQEELEALMEQPVGAISMYVSNSKVVHAFSHAGDMYVLLSDGSLHQRVRNPKNFNQGPAESEPAFFWRKLETPKV